MCFVSLLFCVRDVPQIEFYAPILLIPIRAYQHYQVFIKRFYNLHELVLSEFRFTLFRVISVTHFSANGGAAILPRLRYRRSVTGNMDIVTY